MTGQQAMKIIDSGAIFSVEFVSYDRKRNTGGFLKKMNNVVIQKKTAQETQGSKCNSKPSYLRTVFQMVGNQQSSVARRMNILLILRLNNETVMW